jgi:hypothetical protein
LEIGILELDRLMGKKRSVSCRKEEKKNQRRTGFKAVPAGD